MSTKRKKPDVTRRAVFDVFYPTVNTPKPAPKGQRVVYFKGGTRGDIMKAAELFMALVPVSSPKGIIRMEWTREMDEGL